MKTKFFYLLMPILFATRGQALPLLVESAAQNVSSALTLYPDDHEANKFYFMPNSSRFATDKTNKPVMSFVHWGLSNNKPLAEAGAYMSFVMRLTSDQDQKAALDTFLKSHPGAGISVLPVQSSIVNLTNQDGKPALSGLFSEFNFPRVSGRAEDEVGINAILSGVGAKVMLQGLTRTGALSVFYYYKVQGLGPSMDAKITVKFDRVYDYFKGSASVGGWFWRADISREIQTLQQRGDVDWKINGGTAKDADYITVLAELIVKRLFVAELSATPSGTNNGGSDWSFYRVSLASVHKEELKEENWTIKRQDLIEREFGLPLAVRDLAPYLNDVIGDAEKPVGGN